MGKRADSEMSLLHADDLAAAAESGPQAERLERVREIASGERPSRLRPVGWDAVRQQLTERGLQLKADIARETLTVRPGDGDGFVGMGPEVDHRSEAREV